MLATSKDGGGDCTGLKLGIEPSARKGHMSAISRTAAQSGFLNIESPFTGCCFIMTYPFSQRNTSSKTTLSISETFTALSSDSLKNLPYSPSSTVISDSKRSSTWLRNIFSS
jgi:hypothetical protein